MRRTLLALLAGLAAPGLLRADPEAVSAGELGPDGQPPQVRRQVRPRYPLAMQQARINGEADIEFVVDPDGNVLDAHAVRSTAIDFEVPAVEAVQQWKFAAGRRHGKPVAVRMQVPVVFTLGPDPLTFSSPSLEPGPGPLVDPAATYDLAGLDRPPVAQVMARPQYPFAQRRAGQPGKAVVDFIVDRDGNVVRAFAASATAAAFGDAAVAAVAKWKFQPGFKGGKPVYTHMQVPIEFSPDSEPPPAGYNGPPEPLPPKAEIFDIAKVTRPPVAILQARPLYPPDLLAAKKAGRAVVDFIIDPHGIVAWSRVFNADDPAFGATAVAAVNQWKFHPALKDGQPVFVHLMVPIDFDTN